MAMIIGVSLALIVGVLYTIFHLDRDRAFYPTVTIVVASYYVLFAVIGASTQTVVMESLVGAVFVIVAIYGFRSSLWLVAIALAAHGFLDLVHGAAIANPGVPAWWPAFCMGYDIAAAAYLAWLLGTGRVPAASRQPVASESAA